MLELSNTKEYRVHILQQASTYIYIYIYIYIKTHVHCFTNLQYYVHQPISKSRHCTLYCYAAAFSIRNFFTIELFLIKITFIYDFIKSFSTAVFVPVMSCYTLSKQLDLSGKAFSLFQKLKIQRPANI
jgi:hypothetical protein